MRAYPRDDDWGDWELERRRAKALDRRLDAEDEYTETARRLLASHGWPGARIENAKARDQNSWGTFSHGWHVQVGKAIERLYHQNPGDYK